MTDTNKEGENTVLWIIGVFFVVVTLLLLKDHFRKHTPRERTAATIATAPTQQADPKQPASPSDTGMSFNPRAVMEDPEFADIAPKLPPGVKVPDRLPMPRNPVEQ